MTRDDIIRLAREAGFSFGVTDPTIYAAHERFARLVIAQERERLMEDLAPSGSFVSWNNTKCNPLADPMMQSKSAWDDGYASGVAAEREAIAQMIEDAPPLVDFCKNEQNGCLVCGFTPKFAAAAIRARGQE